MVCSDPSNPTTGFFVEFGDVLYTPNCSTIACFDLILFNDNKYRMGTKRRRNWVMLKAKNLGIKHLIFQM